MYELILIANALLWLGMCAVFWRRAASPVYHPALYYLIFHGLIFVIRPFFAYYGHYDYIYLSYGFYPRMDQKVAVIAASMVGLLAFMAPALLTVGRPMQFADRAVIEDARISLIKPYLLVCALCVPIALYSLIQSILNVQNGVVTMEFVRGTGVAVSRTGNGYFTDVQYMLVPATVLFAWFGRFRLWSLLPFVAFVVARGSTGSRWPIMIGAVAMSLMYLYDRRANFPRPVVLAGIAAAMLVFRMIGDDRGAGLRSAIFGSTEPISQNLQQTRFLESMDFANLEFFEYLVYVIPEKSRTYGYFLDNLQLFTEPVPRSLWAAKPVGAPIQLYNLFDYGYPIGMTYSLPGEGWSQLGWLGVIVWCALFGFLFGKGYAWFAQRQRGVVAALGYLLVLPHVVTFYRDGLLLTFVRTSWFFFLFVFLLAGFARLFGPGSSDNVEQVPDAPRRGRTRSAALLPGPPQQRLTPKARRRARAATMVAAPTPR